MFFSASPVESISRFRLRATCSWHGLVMVCLRMISRNLFAGIFSGWYIGILIKSLWLYVFSSFPPPPQWLLLLTSKPFELHLRYLGQRKYRSGKMYWMTFRWPWLKVTAVTLINKNLLVCRIKWEPLNQSLQNLGGISPWSWLSPD